MSMRFAPESRAACTVAIETASSAVPYMPDIPMAPSAIRETAGPVLPSWTVLRFVVMWTTLRLRAEVRERSLDPGIGDPWLRITAEPAPALWMAGCGACG
ncbi:hypothetical protein GCM10027262_34790 [Nocardia tengchongensis]